MSFVVPWITSYCIQTAPVSHVEAFSVCHHKHFTWPKQRKGPEASEIFISCECIWSGACFHSTTSSLITSECHIRVSGLRCCVDNILLVSMWFFSSPQSHHSGEPAGDPGSVSGRCRRLLCPGSQREERGEQDQSLHPSQRGTWVSKLCRMCCTLRLQTGLTKAAQIKRTSLTKDWSFKGGQCFLLGLEHTELVQKRDLREEMPSTNHPQSPLSAGLLCARQVHDDIPHCLLGSCGYNFFLMQVFIMCCFPLCLSKQVILLSANLFMNLFPGYGIIFTWSYQSPWELAFHCYYLLFYITQVVLTPPLQR